MRTLSAQLLDEIEDFLMRHRMPPTTLGELFCRDPQFVRQIRAGRSIRLDTADRLRAWMAAYRPHGPRRKREKEAA